MTTLIAGLSVAFARSGRVVLARSAQWSMLELFTHHLREPCFAAVKCDAGSAFDVELGEDVPVQFLNRHRFAGFPRVLQTPVVYRRLVPLVQESRLVFARIPSWTGLAAARVARLLGIPLVVSLHGNWDGVFLYGGGSRDRLRNQAMARYAHIATIATLRTARHVFFVGHALAQRYKRHARHHTVVANCAHYAADVCEPVLRAAGSRRRVLFVGEVSRAKGVFVLLEAVQRLLGEGLDLELEVVGDGQDRDLVQRLLDRDGLLRQRVILAGWKKPGRDLDTAYRSAQLLVVPSFAEGVPKVVLEAMVRGVPVVGSSVGDIPWLLGRDERGLLVPPGQSGALASAIRKVLQDPSATWARAREAATYVRRYDRSYYSRVIGEALAQVVPRDVLVDRLL